VATHFRELRVWQNAVELAMDVFEISKAFPPREQFSLTDQVRRSTRSVAAYVTEAWRKRRYVAAFVSKLSDAEAEMAESQTWIEFAARCGYIEPDRAHALDARCEEILSQLAVMIPDADKWCDGFKKH
jgi:four helix bundle protein